MCLVSVVLQLFCACNMQYTVCAMIFHLIKVLYLYISTFRNMCALYGVAVFYNYLMSCFSRVLIRYFVHYFNVVTVTPVFTGITFLLTFHILCISVLSSFYFKIFSASLSITFMSPETAVCIDTFLYVS